MDQHSIKKEKPTYIKERNTLKRAVKDYAPDRLELEIGDSKEDTFFPQAKIMRWDNSANFSIRRDNGARTFKEGKGKDAGKIIAESAKEDVVFYELEAGDIGEDGGLEIELHLKEKPDTNVFDFTLQTKELDFFYQPALTPEEIEQGAERPENVVGSYAVYHKSKRDNVVGGKEYKNGKAFHIYRPHVTDANGAETWAELNIDEQANLLTVTVPQEFLDSAVYPVTVDPTFGYTTGGASSGGGSNLYSGSLFTLSEDATLDSLSGYIVTSQGLAAGMPYSLAVYRHSNLALVANSETKLTFQSGTPSWVVFDAADEVLSADDYVLVMMNSAGGFSSFPSMRYDTGATDQGHHAAYSGGSANPTTPASTLPTVTHNTRKYSIYATYTAAASAPTVTTSAVTDITETTATGNGNVTDDGGATITERGVCWNTTGTPTTSDSTATSAGTTGAFTASMTGLTASTLYYVRAYAINSEGTSYGSEEEFTTEAEAALEVLYDSSASGLAVGASSVTFAHTVSGDNRIMFIGAYAGTNAGDVLTGITYNGVSATYLAKTKFASYDAWLYLYYLIAPDTGTHNVVVSKTGTTSRIEGLSISYTGARQTSQPDAYTTANSTGTSFTTSLTTVADNSVAVLLTASADDFTVAGTNSTSRQNLEGSGSARLWDNNATAITPAGSYSMVVDSAGATTNAMRIMASIAPVAPAGGVNPQVKVSGTFGTKTVKVKVGGTFVDAEMKVKVGGVFQ